MPPSHRYQRIDAVDTTGEPGSAPLNTSIEQDESNGSSRGIQRHVRYRRPSMLSKSEAASMPHAPRHGVGSSTHPSGDMAQNDTSSPIIIGEHNAQCSTKEVESATAMLNLWGNLIAGVLVAVAAPVWGKVSDKYGRIKPLVAASTTFLGSESIIVLIAILPDTFSLNWVYLGFSLEGLSGSFILTMALASSYAADCTSDRERNVALGWFHGSMFFGLAAGPVLGGYIGMSGGQSRPMLIFYFALALRVAGIIFLLIFVPESLSYGRVSTQSLATSPKQISKGIWREILLQRVKNANPVHVFSSKSLTQARVRQNMIALASVNTIMFGAFMGAMNVMLLYSEYTFGWGNKESGIFLSTVNFFRTIATTLVLPLIVRILRRFLAFRSSANKQVAESFDQVDLFLLRASILSDVLGYIGYAIAPTGALFTLSGALASLGAIGLATSEASMTKLVEGSQTGELLGALGLLQAISRIVAPTITSLIYSSTVGKLPSLVLWSVAAGFIAAGAATFWLRPKAGLDKGSKEEVVPLQALNL